MQSGSAVGRWGRVCRQGVWSFFTVVFCLASHVAKAQSVWAQGGTSTLVKASGLDLNYKWAPVRGWVATSFSGGASLSGWLTTRVKSYEIGGGDSFLPLAIYSDIFDQARYFTGRGLFLKHSGERQSWTAFAGATSSDSSYAFFRSFRSEEPTAAFLLLRKLSPAWSLQSFDTVQSGSLTSLESLRLQLREGLQVNGTAGLGANHPFVAAGSEFERPGFQLKVNYSAMKEGFERMGGLVNNAPERVGANIQVRWQPLHGLQLGAGHDNYLSSLSDTEQTAAARHVSLDSMHASAIGKGFRVGIGYSTSKSGSLSSQTESYGLSRNLSPSVASSVTFLRLQSDSGKSSILLVNMQERIGPRFTFQEGLSRTRGENAFTWGMRLLSNRITAAVEHSLYYTPLAGGFAGKNFSQVWSVNLGLNLFGTVRAHVDSMVDPAGRVRYTAWSDGIGFYRGSGDDAPIADRRSVPNFAAFIVRGVVRDTAGAPVWGICVQIDGRTAFTDRSGRFFLRFEKGQQYPFLVLLQASLNAFSYEIVSAPVSVRAEHEDAAEDVIVIVRPSASRRQR